MRIIEVEYLGPPALGGVEALVEALYRGFTASGHQTEIWCSDLASFEGPRYTAGATRSNDLLVRRFPTRRVRCWPFDPHHLVWRGLDKALLAEAGRGAALHLHSFPSDQVFRALRAMAAGAAVVITPHHDVESLRRYLQLTRGKWIASRLRRAARKNPRLNVALHTEAAQKLWREEIGWPPQQVAVIPNGVYLSEFDEITPPEVEQAVRRWPGGGIRLLFVGRLAHSKGVDLLLRALAEIPGAALLAIGPDAGAQAELMGMARELALGSRVGFVPPPQRREVCAAFRACDLFVLPSRYGENFGIAAVEAMAAGKPVVASDRGGLPAVVGHGETGLLFPGESVEGLRQALVKLIGSAPLRRSYGEAGRKKVEASFTWERVISRYLDLFARACRQSA